MALNRYVTNLIKELIKLIALKWRSEYVKCWIKKSPLLHGIPSSSLLGPLVRSAGMYAYVFLAIDYKFTLFQTVADINGF